MPKREPKFTSHGQWHHGKTHMVAVGASHPKEPISGTVTGQNTMGYDEPVLVFPDIFPDTLKLLKMSQVAECALRLRDNLLDRPNRLSRIGGPLEAQEVTWVLCRQEGWFFHPVAAEIGGEPVPQGILEQIWDSVKES